ncbi:redoxin domain-containing protein [Chitinophaga sp. GCM10012297]|uniref:Redoxin domain-containing protein n=1 Tax=Chitinophaga chungangae TaxID=2821488 RepID=A0ABS3YFJ9_9BACT|nr:redoxin domain-containing protein [Chitinophaga chungangae]MBO9153461.1 redoxin domain-containing protein [Chitinophaga chungangae]
MKWFFVILGCFFLPALHAQQPAYASLKLKTTGGETLSPASKPLTAFVFLSPDCPLSRNYTLTLNDIQQSRKNALQIIGVFPDAGYSDNEIKAFKDKYAISFALVSDKRSQLQHFTRAAITPEVFLYDNRGALLYKGAIDDWVVSLGRKKHQPEKHYLADAIDNSLQHKTVSPAETKAIGCFISTK